MTALLGSYCSGASKGIASQANIDNFLQVSYASTSEDLSNVNFYRYFARTAPSDAVQGPLLAKTLIALGLTPYIAVVHQTASYAASLAKSIVQKYGESGQYQVLLTYAFDSESTSDEEYHDIIFRIGQSGAGMTKAQCCFVLMSQLTGGMCCAVVACCCSSLSCDRVRGLPRHRHQGLCGGGAPPRAVHVTGDVGGRGCVDRLAAA